MKKAILFLIGILFFTDSYTQNTWELKKDIQGIQVYYRDNPASDIKELKIVTEIESSLASAISVINDIAEMPNWVFNCAKAEVKAGHIDSSFLFVNTTSFPFPFTDRELVFRCTTYQNIQTKEVHSRCIAEPKAIPINEEYIRVEEALSTWTFVPLAPNKVKAEYFLSLDPGGSIPAWLVNWGLDYGPVKTLKKFKVLVKSDQYRDKKVPYIKEP